MHNKTLQKIVYIYLVISFCGLIVNVRGATQTKLAAKAPSKALGKTPSKSLGKAPFYSKALGKAPSKGVGKTSSKAVAKAPSKALGKAPSKPPAKTSSKSFGKILGRVLTKTSDKAQAQAKAQQEALEAAEAEAKAAAKAAAKSNKWTAKFMPKSAAAKKAAKTAAQAAALAAAQAAAQEAAKAKRAKIPMESHGKIETATPRVWQYRVPSSPNTLLFPQPEEDDLEDEFYDEMEVCDCCEPTVCGIEDEIDQEEEDDRPQCICPQKYRNLEPVIRECPYYPKPKVVEGRRVGCRCSNPYENVIGGLLARVFRNFIKKLIKASCKTADGKHRICASKVNILKNAKEISRYQHVSSYYPHDIKKKTMKPYYFI